MTPNQHTIHAASQNTAKSKAPFVPSKLNIFSIFGKYLDIGLILFLCLV